MGAVDEFQTRVAVRPYRAEFRSLDPSKLQSVDRLKSDKGPTHLEDLKKTNLNTSTVVSFLYIILNER